MAWLPKESVVVPVDFSANSLHAVQTALEFVEEPSQVHAIHVILPLDATSPGVVWGAVDEESRRKAVERYFADYSKKNEWPEVTLAIRHGDPGMEITDYASEIGSGLIVIPSHGYHGVKRLLLGSVAERVIRHAQCGVLVLRRDDAQ